VKHFEFEELHESDCDVTAWSSYAYITEHTVQAVEHVIHAVEYVIHAVEHVIHAE
jgi:hypothetical protein